MKTVVVGMSGGVDSSVSALLLKNQGYRVIGLFMKNWEEDGTCPAVRDFEDVARVCTHLDIPYYTLNFAREYKEQVFSQFLADCKSGLTPNPDILCNREIKFKVFLKKSLDLGANFLATGHYCRLDAKKNLLRGLDPNKDQSYFLHSVEKTAFQNVLFPIGHLLKKELREIARKAKLPTAEKKDSTGICFIGKRNFKSFLSQYIGFSPGHFETLSGEIVGQHDGTAFYTIGQRKGMGLGGEGDAWYVVGKDCARNVVLVERGANHPSLFSTRVQIKNLTWTPSKWGFRCTAKVRYRQKDTPCTLYQDYAIFDEPQRAVTPGQSIVFYENEYCLGGGVIVESF